MTSTSTSTSTNSTIVARSPETWGDAFQQAMRQGDVDAVLSLYEPNASFSSPAGEVRGGHAALREAFAPQAAARAEFNFRIKHVVQSGELALVHTEWRTTRPQEASGYALEVLRRQPDGRWLLVIGDPFTVTR